MADKNPATTDRGGEFLISIQRPSQEDITPPDPRTTRTSLPDLFNPPGTSTSAENSTLPAMPAMKSRNLLPALEPNYDNQLTMNSIQLQALKEMVSDLARAPAEGGDGFEEETAYGVGDGGYDIELENLSARKALAAGKESGQNETVDPDQDEDVGGDVDPDGERALPRFPTLEFEGRPGGKQRITHQKHKERVVKSHKPGPKKDTDSISSATTNNNASGPSNVIDITKKDVQDTCVLCERPLPRPLESQTIQLRKLKPRFLREIRRLHPTRPLNPASRICIKDLHAVLQTRIELLLEEDQTQLAQLLDDAMKNLGEYEQNEPQWQKQFETGWTLSEKAADNTNYKIRVLAKYAPDSAWDPFPFILLNLFLSSVAALQAPIIMMSQNRQSQIDRTQTAYVSKIILRAEHQVRHVNAKVDHLLSHQWKRLLEIQEIEIDLLQSLQIQHRKLLSWQQPPSPQKAVHSPHPHDLPAGRNLLPHSPSSWVVETNRDDHARTLLSFAYGAGKDMPDNRLVFAHWHTDGDNFMGIVDDVKVELRGVGLIKKITYTVHFNDPTATLDDVFSGEGTVTLRNDFDVKHMVLGGKIASVSIYMKDKPPTTFLNGDLPPRYKSNFGTFKRYDRITDFWKLPITQLVISYVPPFQGAVLTLKPAQTVRRIRIDFFQNVGAKTANLFMRTVAGQLPTVGGLKNSASTKGPFSSLASAAVASSTAAPSVLPEGEVAKDNHPPPTLAVQPFLDPLGYIKALTGPRPFPEEIWKKVASADWSSEAKPKPALGESHGIDPLLMEPGPVTVVFEEELKGPATYIFLCDETKVAFHAIIEE
ncbi:hypothetical protein HDU97_005252 [Phlyctochytrium planicorne]|nr:hypothetical protein HDU97_005252 [Phlyctochytrium planicorne]